LERSLSLPLARTVPQGATERDRMRRRGPKSVTRSTRLRRATERSLLLPVTAPKACKRHASC